MLTEVELISILNIVFSVILLVVNKSYLFILLFTVHTKITSSICHLYCSGGATNGHYIRESRTHLHSYLIILSFMTD